MSTDQDPEPPTTACLRNQPPWRAALFAGPPGGAHEMIKVLAWKPAALAAALASLNTTSITDLDAEDLQHLLHAATLTRRAAAWAEDMILLELMSRPTGTRPTAQDIADAIGVHRATVAEWADRAGDNLAAVDEALRAAKADGPQVTLTCYRSGWELSVNGNVADTWAATVPTGLVLPAAAATASDRIGCPLAGWEQVTDTDTTCRTYRGVVIPPARARR